MGGSDYAMDEFFGMCRKDAVGHGWRESDSPNLLGSCHDGAGISLILPPEDDGMAGLLLGFGRNGRRRGF